MRKVNIIPPDSYCGEGYIVKMDISPEEFEKIRLKLTLELNERNIFSGFRIVISRDEYPCGRKLSDTPDINGMWEYWLIIEKKKEADKLLP